VQVHGRHGYIEEKTGAAQHYADARIAPVYEGTNGSGDHLVTRKLPSGGGWDGEGLIGRKSKRFVEAVKTPTNDPGSAGPGVAAADAEPRRWERATGGNWASSAAAQRPHRGPRRRDPPYLRAVRARGRRRRARRGRHSQRCGWVVMEPRATGTELRSRDSSPSKCRRAGRGASSARSVQAARTASTHCGTRRWLESICVRQGGLTNADAS